MAITINGSGTITGASTLATTVVSPTLTTPVATTTIGVGNTTPSASGSGISFPATQSASSDVNTLDDYEEGTWTPILLISGVSTGITQSSSVASYVKVGSMVTCEFQISLSNKGSNGGAVTLVLPFTHKSQNDLYGNCFFIRL